jgi:apolipoprotein N-acyltransferase
MSAAANPRYAWLRSTLAIGLAGSLLLGAALPPLSLSWLGWIAPVPWLLLVRADQLPGRRPYRSLWLAGLAFWLMAVHWLRLPHPATSLGWVALSAYLACYLPVFVGLSRVAVHRLRAPLWLAAPVVWTGLELARAHLLTGFLMASIAHTQANCTPLIQISDLVGEYGVDFVIVLVAACIADFGLRTTLRAVPADCGLKNPKLILPPLLAATVALAGVLSYGQLRLRNTQPGTAARAGNPQSEIHDPKSIRIALVQGNSLAEWKADPSRERQIMDEYLALSERAVDIAQKRGDGRPLDLIVWPETMFRSSLVSFDADYRLPPGVSQTKEEIAAYGPADLVSLVARLETPVLVGVDRYHFTTASASAADLRPLSYNSAALVDGDGKIIGTYDKVHRVMFGEYIPFARQLPFLYRLTPLTGGIEPGGEPAGLKLDNTTYAPNICYETAIPHVIRRQVAALSARGESPDILVNLTNDAWYWGSSELDMHLACGVFRAVEARRPLVIAANGGISAWIDARGRIRAQSPRLQADVIVADVEIRDLQSWYIEHGDWFAGACLTCCIALAIFGWRTRHNPQPPAPSP